MGSKGGLNGNACKLEMGSKGGQARALQLETKGYKEMGRKGGLATIDMSGGEAVEAKGVDIDESKFASAQLSISVLDFKYISRQRNQPMMAQYEARALIMHQERIEAQLQVHFQSIQRISDSTTLPFILLRLKSQIVSLLDLSRLTEELEQDKDNSRLSAQEKDLTMEEYKNIKF
ncbi:hypothetical protein L7F22_056487 [Adiantum nelumboides]|nr:hypothetical protein [Adiantum nelumboides]